MLRAGRECFSSSKDCLHKEQSSCVQNMILHETDTNAYIDAVSIDAPSVGESSVNTQAFINEKNMYASFFFEFAVCLI